MTIGSHLAPGPWVAPAVTDGFDRAGAQHGVLKLSQRDDVEARQSTLAAAPARWQPVIQHYLAWRVGMGALRATLWKSEPATESK